MTSINEIVCLSEEFPNCLGIFGKIQNLLFVLVGYDPFRVKLLKQNSRTISGSDMKKLGFISWLALYPFQIFAIAQETLFDSVRANGRGKTFLAAYDSDEATRLNPATLKETNITYQLRLAQFDLFVGENVIDSISDIMDAFSDSDLDGTSLLKTFSDKFGKRQYVKLQGSLFAQRFGAHELAPLFIQTGSLDLQDPNVPELSWKSDTIAGISWSSGFRVANNLYLGLTLRPFYRWYIKGDIASAELTDFVSSSVDVSSIVPVRSGFGLGGDIGMIYTPSKDFRLGAKIENFTDAGYFQDTGNEPPALRQNISFGVLKRKSITPRINLDFLADYQDLLNRDGTSMLRHLHLGTELGASVVSRDNDYGIMMGINEGYLTYGTYFDIYIMRFDISHYVVELGESPGQIPDKIWAASMRSSITF